MSRAKSEEARLSAGSVGAPLGISGSCVSEQGVGKEKKGQFPRKRGSRVDREKTCKFNDTCCAMWGLCHTVGAYIT